MIGIIGENAKNPEIPGLSVFAIYTALKLGAMYGPGVALPFGFAEAVGFVVKEDKVARACAKAMGYTPWFLQKP